ncbi:response regulator [Methylomonas sp. EFPC1]|uniref:Response regulator n=1 Tax=Methylomonas defluvii TaxID=3045149 RepID=A0ABU4U972_9GAMM|nr:MULTISPECIES: response regulator [unclassified Methylomonas]MDX8125978.1 response regulator [Methylomonas sp. OY6]QSB01919.1 response regulator [Methylomonas sp. EFPC1]
MTNDFSILIADDNEINLWLLREQLEYWTTNITSAKDGREAWQLLQERRYDFIFLDVNMPFLSGFDVAANLRGTENYNRQTPAVAVTAHAQNQQQERAIAAGFNECLVKPVRLYQLEQLLVRWRQHEPVNAEYYAGQLLRKAQHNRQLSQVLMGKLFEQLPGLILDIERALDNRLLQQAWDLNHKLHGTFCFYDFADCLAVVENLQKALVQADAELAQQRFNTMKIKLIRLLDNQDQVLKCLGDDDPIL